MSDLRRRRYPSQTMPCASCNEPMWRNRETSLPEGQARCRSCRRAAWGLPPDARVSDFKRQPKPRNPCARCGGPVTPEPGSRRWKFCTDECFRKARNARGGGRPSATQRGYGKDHVALRATLLPLAYGTPCALCGDVMNEGEELHLDHTEDRSDYRGMTHAACNVLDGALRGGQAAREKRLREGWRPGQDPGTRRRPTRTAA